jgi:hypothetical protein
MSKYLKKYINDLIIEVDQSKIKDLKYTINRCFELYKEDITKGDMKPMQCKSVSDWIAEEPKIKGLKEYNNFLEEQKSKGLLAIGQDTLDKCLISKELLIPNDPSHVFNFEVPVKPPPKSAPKPAPKVESEPDPAPPVSLKPVVGSETSSYTYDPEFKLTGTNISIICERLVQNWINFDYNRNKDDPNKGVSNPTMADYSKFVIENETPKGLSKKIITRAEIDFCLARAGKTIPTGDLIRLLPAVVPAKVAPAKVLVDSAAADTSTAATAAPAAKPVISLKDAVAARFASLKPPKRIITAPLDEIKCKQIINWYVQETVYKNDLKDISNLIKDFSNDIDISETSIKECLLFFNNNYKKKYSTLSFLERTNLDEKIAEWNKQNPPKEPSSKDSRGSDAWSD